MKKRKSRKDVVKPAIGIGISSIMLIFLVVCFSVFSILALMSAKADYKMNQKISDSFSEYYEVNQKAQELVAQIDEQLKQAYEEAASEKEYQKIACQKLLEIKGIEIEEKQIDFQVETDDSKALAVELEICYPRETEDSLYQIKKWKVELSDSWNPDSKIKVYQK
jgi:anaerobic ribonucleoside-triphosphate reductase